MRLDDRFIDDLKSQVQPSDLIGRTVKLKRQGREYVGLSPFTNERSPSFFVNDEKGFYHCFSSGKHGDVIDFLVETERLTFREAVERLAGEAGVAMPDVDPRAAEQERQRQGLADWLGLAATWFSAELRRPAGQAAREYLERRGLGEAEWTRFQIGFAPGARTGLKDYLVAKGARPAELVDGGLLITPEDGSAPYDRFRDRIIFPIADARGRIVSFGGRAMDPEARAKYLNGPETTLFSKGRLLYGLPEARKLLHAGGDATALVVVEGYMDAIACQRAGVAAVAPLGTALTEDQMEVLWRLHPEPTLCFDGDAAGMRAASRSIDRALPMLKAGRSIRFSIVAGGKDPDDVLRDHGAEALRDQLSRTTSLVEALFGRERDREPTDTPERLAGLRRRLIDAPSSITDPDLARTYRADLLQRFDRINPGASSGVRRRQPLAPSFTDQGKAAALRLADRPGVAAARVALAAINNPDWLEGRDEVLAMTGFGDARLGALANWLLTERLGGEPGPFPATEADAARAVAGPGQLSREDWGREFDRVTRLAAVEEAIRSASADVESDADLKVLAQLRAERVSLRGAA